jgi:hypothetical protein
MTAQTFRFRFQLFTLDALSAHTHVEASDMLTASVQLLSSLKPWESARLLSGPSLPDGNFYGRA